MIDPVVSLLPSFSDLPDSLQYVLIGIFILFFLFLLWIICKIKDCFCCFFSICQCLFCCCKKKYKKLEKKSDQSI